MANGKRNDSTLPVQRNNRRGIALIALGALAAAALAVCSKTREAEQTHLPAGNSSKSTASGCTMSNGDRGSLWCCCMATAA